MKNSDRWFEKNKKTYFYRYLKRYLTSKKDNVITHEVLEFLNKKYNRLYNYIKLRRIREQMFKDNIVKLDILCKFITSFEKEDFEERINILKERYKDKNKLLNIEGVYKFVILEDMNLYEQVTDKLLEIILYLRENNDKDIKIKMKHIKNKYMSIDDICVTLLGSEYINRERR